MEGKLAPHFGKETKAIASPTPIYIVLVYLIKGLFTNSYRTFGSGEGEAIDIDPFTNKCIRGLGVRFARN